MKINKKEILLILLLKPPTKTQLIMAEILIAWNLKIKKENSNFPNIG